MFSLTLGPTQLPAQRVTDLSRCKAAGCGVDHPPSSSTEVKENVKLYLYFLPELS